MCPESVITRPEGWSGGACSGSVFFRIPISRIVISSKRVMAAATIHSNRLVLGFPAIISPMMDDDMTPFVLRKFPQPLYAATIRVSL